MSSIKLIFNIISVNNFKLNKSNMGLIGVEKGENKLNNI